MTKKRITQAAVDLVAAWDAGRDDTDPRAYLIDVVHEFLKPPRPVACNVRQGRTDSRKFGGGHYLLPAVAEKLVDSLRLGLSLRQVCKEVGVSKGTAARYERLNGPFVCPCGRERTHRGWCSERLKRSPLRRAFLSEWTRQQVAAGTHRGGRRPKQAVIIEPRVIERNWPYLSGKPSDGNVLIDAVNAAVPRTFEDFQRADICQDLLLAILEGETTIENIKNGSAACIKRYWKLHPGKFGPLSLDAPIPGTEGLTLADTIRSDAPHF